MIVTSGRSVEGLVDDGLDDREPMGGGILEKGKINRLAEIA